MAVVTLEVDVVVLDISHIEVETQTTEVKDVEAELVEDEVTEMTTPHPIQVVITLTYHHLSGMP
jgi:hypothetical protein